VRARRVRTDGIKTVKGADLSKDDTARLEACVSALADAATTELTDMFESKKTEIESK
jgi:ribosome recycling factor